MRAVKWDVFEFAELIAEEVLRVHRRHPIDVIEMEESFGWFEYVRRKTSLPLLVKLHGPAFLSMVAEELDSPFGREKVEREGKALRFASAIASPSQTTLTQTIERYQLAPRDQWLIVNPVTLGSDAPVWSLDTCDRDTVLFVGRFDLRKGADVLLQAFLALLRCCPASRLIFVGPDHGVLGPGGERFGFDQYRDWLFPPELRDRIDYRGALAYSDIIRLRAKAMVTVVASRWENQAYTLLEAMLQGCPVVTTDAGGCPESVIPNVNAKLARSEHPEDFAAAMQSLLDDPGHAAALGRAARQYVIEQHSAAKVAGEALEIYRTTISQQQR